MTATDVVVWTDGGARGNPGPAGFGAVVTTPGGRVLAEVAEGIGWATNNVAEYRGVIAGLRRAAELGAGSGSGPTRCWWSTSRRASGR